MNNAIFQDIDKYPEDMARGEILACFKRLKALAAEHRCVKGAVIKLNDMAPAF